MITSYINRLKNVGHDQTVSNEIFNRYYQSGTLDVLDAILNNLEGKKRDREVLLNASEKDQA